MNRAQLIISLAIFPMVTLSATVDTDSLCLGYGEMASSIMNARQAGVSIDRALAIAAESEPPLSDVARGMVIDAYHHPRYTTPWMVERTISEFKTGEAVKCLLAIGKGESK